MAGKTRYRDCEVGIHIASSVRNQRENAGAQFLCPCHLPHHTHNFRLLIIYVSKCACAWVCVPVCLRLQISLELDYRRMWALQEQAALFTAEPFLQPPYFPLFILSEIPAHGAIELCVSISVPRLKLWKQATPRVIYHPGHSKPRQGDREEKLAGTAGYILAMGRNLV